MEGKRKRQELPDGSGWGDHIQLLQIFESWGQTGYDPKWCSDHDLQVTKKNILLICFMRKTYARVVSKSKMQSSWITQDRRNKRQHMRFPENTLVTHVIMHFHDSSYSHNFYLNFSVGQRQMLGINESIRNSAIMSKFQLFVQIWGSCTILIQISVWKLRIVSIFEGPLYINVMAVG